VQPGEKRRQHDETEHIEGKIGGAAVAPGYEILVHFIKNCIRCSRGKCELLRLFQRPVQTEGAVEKDAEQSEFQEMHNFVCVREQQVRYRASRQR